MIETLELRVNEEHASRVFSDTEGVRLGQWVRKVVLSVDDPRLAQVREIDLELRANGARLFGWWYFHRKYKPAELRDAPLLTVGVAPSHLFSGEEAGTTYDESTACPVCGAGRRQVGPLRLRMGKLPRVNDIVLSSTDEWIVSARFVDAFRRADGMGAEFAPIEFRRAPKDAAPSWYHLIPTGPPARVHPRTRCGGSPFPDPIDDAKYDCPLGDTRGSSPISEIYIAAAHPPAEDVTITRQYFGSRMGMFVPTRQLLISPRMWIALKDAAIVGVKVQVAHLTAD